MRISLVCTPALLLTLSAIGCDSGGDGGSDETDTDASGTSPSTSGTNPSTTNPTEPTGPGSTSDDATTDDTVADASSSSGGIEPPPGYSVGRELFRGSEAMLYNEYAALGLSMEGYPVMSLDLSGDGNTLWVAVYNEYADAGPDYRVYSMDTGGTNVEESAVVRPDDAPYAPQLFRVRTTESGEVGILTQYTYDSMDRVVAQIERASRGGAFAVLTQSDGATEALGLAETVSTEVTDSGDAVIFETGRNIWRANESDGWAPFVIAQVDNLTWEGEALPGNSVFNGLSLSDNGGEFATYVDLSASEAAIIVGTGINSTSIEAVADARTTDFYASAELDNAGETITYSNPSSTWVGEQGGSHDLTEVPLGTVQNADLAGDGQTFHASIISPNINPFWQDIESGQRTISMSPTWLYYMGPSAVNGAVSDDGTVLVSAIKDGVIAVHRGTEAYGASVDHVFWRFDEEGSLVVRAVVSSADEVKNVVVNPLWERWLRPSMLFEFEEDPTYTYRNGLNLEPVEGEPDTWEGVMPLNADATNELDERYSFRVTVQQGPAGNADVTSTGFMDFDLFE